ncbi:hypothetical protein RRG08_016378 [Elysia crispata]|uniref:Secreted protein n=1 Tax=Elysia crispata TaxID=231223 RepID=A0AAE1DXM2_9GAST|nr:hypothetical protein RRG08_016378 [Elysia crispata]
MQTVVALFPFSLLLTWAGWVCDVAVFGYERVKLWGQGLMACRLRHQRTIREVSKSTFRKKGEKREIITPAPPKKSHRLKSPAVKVSRDNNSLPCKNLIG